MLAGAPRCFVWRLRIPFNERDNPRNYLSKIMHYERLLDAENSLSQLDEFVRASWECWERRTPFGTYNITNPGSMTTREIAELILGSGVLHKQFNFFASEAEFLRTVAKTPRSNCVLDSSKVQRAGVQLTPVREAIETALKDWVSA